MNQQVKSKRIRERLELRLPVRIHCRETPDFEWTEMTRLVNVTPFGAGFTLKRPTERGRLLHMTIPMPRQLRVFDHVEDQYRVWALVRYLRPILSPEDKTPCFEVGVAFVGKRPPASYEENPARRYEIASDISQIGLMTVDDQAGENIRPVQDSVPRAHTRHNIPVAMSVETLGEKGEVKETENTVTENISRGGATIYTSLDLPVGRFLRLTSPEYNLTVHAVVRGRSKGAGGMPRMHVEFIERQWPVD
jgi:PilZ domain